MTWRRKRSGGGEVRSDRTTPSACPEAELFAFWEDCLRGIGRTAPLIEQAHSVSWALELANDDWPEPDAIRELLLLVSGDRRVLGRTYRVLVAGVLRNPLPDPPGVRASRLVLAALRGGGPA